LPADVITALQVDGSTTADFVVAKHSLLSSIMPSIEELKLLTHCRQVNVDYKELSAGSSDGYFSVVMSSRLPEKDKKYVACLVSVEQRWDLVPTDPPESSDAEWSVPPWWHVGREQGGVVQQHEVHEVPTASAPASAPAQSAQATQAGGVGGGESPEQQAPMP